MNIFIRNNTGEVQCVGFFLYYNIFEDIVKSQVKETPVLDSVINKFNNGVSEVVFTDKNNLEENEVSLTLFIKELEILINYAIDRNLSVREEYTLFRLVEYAVFSYNNNAELIITSS